MRPLLCICQVRPSIRRRQIVTCRAEDREELFNIMPLARLSFFIVAVVKTEGLVLDIL